MRGISVILAGLLSVFISLSAVALIAAAATSGDGDYGIGDHPEIVRSFSGLENKLGLNKAHSGDVITIGGVKFDKGLGLHCNPAGTESYIELDISGLDYAYFTAYVGLQSYSKDGTFLDWGSIAFRVYGDGQLLAFTDTLKYGDAPVVISCPVSGVSTLRLVEDCVDGHSCDWGVWGDAKLTNGKPEEQTVPEPEFTPDKTDLPTPDDRLTGAFTYVSDMYWTGCASYATNPVLRDANTVNEWIFDSDLNVFEKGIGMHASSADYTSFVEVNIKDMGFSTFATYYGICGTTSAYDITMARVTFAVFGDGIKLFESGVMTYGQPFDYAECDVTGVSVLRIAIAGATSISGAWGTWGGAVLIKDGDGREILKDAFEDLDLPDGDDTDAPDDEDTDAADVTADTDAPTDTDITPDTDTPADRDEPTDPADAPDTEPVSGTQATSETVPAQTYDEPEQPGDNFTGCFSGVALGTVVATGAAGLAVSLKKKEDGGDGK